MSTSPIQSQALIDKVSPEAVNFNAQPIKRAFSPRIKRAVNWVLHLWGYHLTHYPKPYKRRTNQLELPLPEKKQEENPI